MMSNESVAWKMCSSGLDSFTQDVQYEKIAMDWVMEYQPEHYNVLMRRLPGGPWQPGKCRLRWLRLVIEPPFHPEPQAFGCIWLIGEQGKVSGYGGIWPKLNSTRWFTESFGCQAGVPDWERLVEGSASDLLLGQHGGFTGWCFH